MLLSLLSKRTLHDDSRDTYGFTVRPQHVHRYREYADIYKEEEHERLNKWKIFLQQQLDPRSGHNLEEENAEVVSEVTKQQNEDTRLRGEGDSTEKTPRAEQTEAAAVASGEGDQPIVHRTISDTQEENVPAKEVPVSQHKVSNEQRKWAEIRPSLHAIDRMMSPRVKKIKNVKGEKMTPKHSDLPSVDEETPLREEPDDEDVFYDNEITKDGADTSTAEGKSTGSDETRHEAFLAWKQELEFLVHGGVPKDLRGEVWQAFIGVSTRRMKRYYQNLLDIEFDSGEVKAHGELLLDTDNRQLNTKGFDLPDKLKKQIEKDLPRTFPGHPALNENGRNSLRRVLLAYARHNPSVGYCQAMNFFAGLLLLMMPEENAFWALVGIIDDYFDGYFSQEMTESQVDQLVFEDLMRERFPKLVNHLDYLGIEVAWISGPWFLSIFVNMLPWESVLRVWDVLLFEGNRIMIFRTALALMDLYGPALVTTKDAGDAITLLQTLAGSTFDSSQLVLTACMGYLNITEDRLQELREKHRPSILAAAEERAKGCHVFKDTKRLASKLYSFKHERKSAAGSPHKTGLDEVPILESHTENVEEFLKGIAGDSEVDFLPDLQEQVIWLKVELCKQLEEKRSSVLRTEELEAALMEMVKQDNCRELSARTEQLEQQVAELRQALSDAKEGEQAMLQVLMKVEQEQRVNEDARLFAEKEAAAQKYAVHVLQEKCETAMKVRINGRAVMAETMLEATLQYESGQSKLSASQVGADSSGDVATRRTGLLSFGLGWRDRKGKTKYCCGTC